MLKEAFRVLKKGGRIGVSVWGRPENSSFFTLLPSILKKHGIQLPNKRSNFHLGDRENLVKMFEDAGFTGIQAWYQFVP